MQTRIGAGISERTFYRVAQRKLGALLECCESPEIPDLDVEFREFLKITARSERQRPKLAAVRTQSWAISATVLTVGAFK
jgi:hypothetical protein